MSINVEVGRGTWKLLHEMAAAYPNRPTDLERHKMVQFLYLLAEFYPCSECGENMYQYLLLFPPRVNSRIDLEMYLCQFHNSVNHRLGKRLFNCEFVVDREGE